MGDANWREEIDMGQLMGLDSVALHLALLEARRQQERYECSLAPVKGIVGGVIVGLAGWGGLLLGWVLVT